jgi:restriction system protein
MGADSQKITPIAQSTMRKLPSTICRLRQYLLRLATMTPNIEPPTPPEVVMFIPRILSTLRDMNGVAKAGAVKAAVVQAIAEAGESVNDQMLASGVPKYQNDIYWARMYLVNAGLLEPAKTAGHGTWKLTTQGWESPLDMATAAAIYYQTASKGSKNKDESNLPAPSGDDAQQDLEGTVNWQVQLKEILWSLSDQGFEHLCAAIMTANGLEQIKVTGKSGDKGIDGMGVMYLDDAGLVSIRVAWQCKRYTSSTVGSMEVRNFRGSLDHKTDHGIIFTTSTFTADAMKESVDLGKTPIRLVPLDQLIQMLKNLKLGVGPEPGYLVDAAFFEQYRKSWSHAQAVSLPLLVPPPDGDPQNRALRPHEALSPPSQ